MRRSQAHVLQLATLALCLAAHGPAGAAPSEDPEGYGVKWSNGLKLSRNDGYHEIQIGGRAYLDFATVSASRGLGDAFPLIGVSGNGVEARAARLFVSGKLYDRILFKTDYDFAPTTTALKDVYIGIDRIPFVGRVRVGHFYEPFSLEQMGSSRFTTFMERGLPVVFSPGRNVGIDFGNTLADGRIVWAFGAFRETNDSGLGFDNDNAYDLTGRIAALPFYAEDGRQLVHVGASYSHQFRQADAPVTGRPRYRERPEVHLAPRFVDTGALAADGVDLVNASLAAVFGPGSIQGEYSMASVDPASGSRPMLWGAYVEASWFLTGENRSYDRGHGAFSRVKPRANFDPGKGQWGAWQVAARYSYLDLDDETVTGGRMRDVTGGINWYLVPNARLMANYVYSDVRGVGHAHMYEMRAQIDF